MTNELQLLILAALTAKAIPSGPGDRIGGRVGSASRASTCAGTGRACSVAGAPSMLRFVPQCQRGASSSPKRNFKKPLIGG